MMLVPPGLTTIVCVTSLYATWRTEISCLPGTSRIFCWPSVHSHSRDTAIDPDARAFVDIRLGIEIYLAENLICVLSMRCACDAEPKHERNGCCSYGNKSNHLIPLSGRKLFNEESRGNFTLGLSTVRYAEKKKAVRFRERPGCYEKADRTTDVATQPLRRTLAPAFPSLRE